MARTSIYLNFMGNTEDAFDFYRQVFDTDFVAPIQRMRDVPGMELPAHELDKVMHVELPILGGLILMGTDMLESMGHVLTLGNNISINLEPDTRAETDRLYAALAAGGDPGMAPQAMFWGGYFGSCVDRFGIHWMFNCAADAYR